MQKHAFLSRLGSYLRHRYWCRGGHCMLADSRRPLDRGALDFGLWRGGGKKLHCWWFAREIEARALSQSVPHMDVTAAGWLALVRCLARRFNFTLIVAPNSTCATRKTVMFVRRWMGWDDLASARFARPRGRGQQCAVHCELSCRLQVVGKLQVVVAVAVRDGG